MHWHLNDTNHFIALKTQSWIFINIDKISLTHVQWMLSAKWYVIMCFIFNDVSKMMLQCISLLHFIQWMSVCVLCSVDDVIKMMLQCVFHVGCQQNDVAMLPCVYYLNHCTFHVQWIMSAKCCNSFSYSSRWCGTMRWWSQPGRSQMKPSIISSTNSTLCKKWVQLFLSGLNVVSQVYPRHCFLWVAASSIVKRDRFVVFLLHCVMCIWMLTAFLCFRSSSTLMSRQ